MEFDVTPYVKLTKLLPSDFENLVVYINDTDIFDNTLSIPEPYGINEAKNFIRTIQEIEKKEIFPKFWAIRHQEKGLIGLISDVSVDTSNMHKIEIGYWIGKAFRGKGIMKKSLKVYLNEFCFDMLGCVRVEATIFQSNKSSWGLLESLGFEREGLMKKYALKKGRFLDVFMYALLNKSVL